MRYSLSLTWWLFLASAWAGAAYFLDLHHHLVWGKVGLILLKASYLGFAVVLLARFLSFSSQRNLETMMDAYNRISNQDTGVQPKRKTSLFNPLFLGLLIIFTTADFLLFFRWSEFAFKTTLVFDLAIWLMVIYWVSRVHWLKSMGRREKLKEQLDDARSRHKQSAETDSKPQPEPEDSGKKKRTSVLVQGVMATGLALYLGGDRWQRSSRVFRVADLKSCMDQCLVLGVESYFQHGKLGRDLGAYCLEQRQEQIRVTLGVRDGEVYVRAMESAGGDYFGNGLTGDEGLVLDAGGRFRKVGREAL